MNQGKLVFAQLMEHMGSTLVNAQLSRLEQDAVEDTDLAHVVQEGADALAASKVSGTGLNQAQIDAYTMWLAI